MPLNSLLLPLYWLLNGFLAFLYLLGEHLLAVLLLPLLGWLTSTTEKAQQSWMLAASGLALAAALFAPTVVPIFLLLMTGGSLVIIKLEKFNPALMRWRATGGIALYALTGLGITLYQALAPLLTDPALAQGQNYLNVIIGLAIYLLPLGFLGMLAQAIWVHPPMSARPGEIITNIRTRGHQER